MSKDKISIIIPCYNEEECIKTFYDEINKVSKKIPVDFEFIYVNDGSTDKSIDCMKDLHRKDDRVKFISFSRNFGKEAAMLAGLEHSTGDYIAIMDADLQDPPEMLIEMYKGVKEEDYDCVALYAKKHKDYSFLRNGFTKLWYKIINKVSSVHQVPGARDFRLMSRKMVNSLLKMNEFNRYIKGLFSYAGFETKWIGYEIPNRKEGTSKFSLSKLFKYGVEGIVSFSTKPLLISAYLGLLFCVISFIFMIYIIIKTLVVGNGVSGWPTIVCLITFLGGLQLFFLGVIGIYISKIYMEVKGRPIYIVKETDEDM